MKRFTPEEDEFIREFYPTRDTKFLAEQLRTSVPSVKGRASYIKVRKEPRFNAQKAADLLGVVRSTVVQWIQCNSLKANRAGRWVGLRQEWIIDPKDFTNFLRDYYYLYDPDRVKDKFLRSIIETTPAAKAIPVCQAVKVLGMVGPAVTRWARKGKFPVAYKGFGPSGHSRWYVQLDESAFQWFRELADDTYDYGDRAAEWIVEVASLRNPDSIIILNVLLKYEQERIKKILRKIQGRPAANKIVQTFIATPEGERLKSLIDESPGFNRTRAF